MKPHRISIEQGGARGLSKGIKNHGQHGLACSQIPALPASFAPIEKSETGGSAENSDLLLHVGEPLLDLVDGDVMVEKHPERQTKHRLAVAGIAPIT